MQENPGPQLPYGTQPPGPPAYPYQPPPVPAREPWFLPTPQGARYDHLARVSDRGPWREIVGTIVVAIAFVVIGAVVLFVGAVLATILGIPAPLRPDQLFGDPVFGLVVLLLSIAAVLPAVFGTVALVQRRRPGSLSSVAGRLRWPWLLRCLVLAVIALALGQAAQAVAMMVTGKQVTDMFGWAGWSAFLPSLIAIALLVPFQAAAEEYIFRGWVLQAFGAHLRNPIWGILLGSALFAALHGYTWAGLVDVFSFGALMGWLAVRTGGLEAPIALHVTNNVLAFGISAAAGELDKALQQGEVPWQSLAGTVVQLSVFAVGVMYLAKKRSVGTVSG
ncbi:CPBP family intramembrane glutamic endopeptidase [Nonomuraea guangzhouensis]|uniref:CPBP family intramembrane glutamic endopeptidase n=1 Tax=Nonomuraea guangzhouensis TaxID=1291555 RepID=A0ABW4GM13_9ACTN|nr:CPBP family intramembrane glutamic endopeptidase [Nonomuraea guangzhouensis]